MRISAIKIDCIPSVNIKRWSGQKSNKIIQFFRIDVETPFWKIVFCALHGLNLKSEQSWSMFHNYIMMKQILLIFYQLTRDQPPFNSVKL